MPKKKKTIFVTGAAGYIGGQTGLQLADAKEYRIIGLDTVSLPPHLRGVYDLFLQEDFASRAGLAAIEEYAPHAIIHCAGSSLVGPSVNKPADYYNNNFVKTKAMLDHIRDRKIDTRVIFSSSAAAYGEPIMVPCAEIDPVEPISPYGQSKLMIEWMLKAYRRAYGLDYVAFRYFNACGADSQGRHGQRPGATHIIARVLESIRDNTEFTLYGEDYDTEDGTCIRDYVHVGDIAAAHIQAIDRSLPSDVFNLGTKTGASNRQVIAAAEKITSKTANLAVGPRREGDPAILTATAERWNKASGWEPEFDLEDMISHAWRWYTR